MEKSAEKTKVYKLNNFFIPVLLLVMITAGVFCCLQIRAEKKEPMRQGGPKRAIILSPEESIEKMKIEEGFAVQLVAAEPLISTPVALTFDARGRIWAVELNGYMHDTLGSGENLPNGKIVILDDQDKDGVMDSRKVFLDSLVMPRAVCLIGNGILVAEPPRLWYYEIHRDKPGKRVLVDGKYAEGGNVQHQPNGLIRALDNWIYNAKSTKRYRKNGDKWLIEPTHFRGQWGISQDNYGRLFYNTNSDNLLGDYFAPGLGATNKNQRSVAGFNEKIVADNRLYPCRPNAGVNRGYLEGILDDQSRLVNFTAAAGSTVYRGGLLGLNGQTNAFVSEPAANLIKRNILGGKGYISTGRQAYQGKEFLASTDERFRPVNLYNGPDGALYIVDMHRGILDHVTYMTSYLKNQIGQRHLTLPLNCGRIYKVVPKDKAVQPVSLPHDAAALVKLLGHANGWVRDKAQQMLIDGSYTQAVPALRRALKQRHNALLAIHALWTLEGLKALPAEQVGALLKDADWLIRRQALTVLPSVINKASWQALVPELQQMIVEKDTLAAPYVAFMAHYIRAFDPPAAQNMVAAVVKSFPDNKYVVDAAISSLPDGGEAAFLKELTAFLPGGNRLIHKQLQLAMVNKEKAQAKLDPAVLKKEFPKGAALFVYRCQPCHGADGNGIKSLAPPLNQSEWVNGNKNKLIAIVLFGLTGPIKVNDHLYQAPEINGDMPAIGYDQRLSDEAVAQVLGFIRKSWRNEADKVSAQEVAAMRQKFKGRQQAFTMKELDLMN
jgi:mono/diheme cytochrome c family protein